MAARKEVAADQANQESEGGGEEDEEEKEDEEGFCEYDSTWEEEEDGEQLEESRGKKGSEAPPTVTHAKEAKHQEKHDGWSPTAFRASCNQAWRKPNRSSMGLRRWKSTSRRNWMAARDMQKYRQQYLDLEEPEVEEEDMWNLSFYKNEIHFKPHGLHIEEIFENWQNDYAALEENHSYIQWLFPLREQGMNMLARILTCREIKAFRESKEVMERFVRAYKLMLGFYGIDLVNEETGELKRAENWYERFENLNRYSHNNLRITRILKCLGEMGYEHYQVQLVKFFLTETLVHQQLPRVLRSALDYFMFTVRNKRKRRELVHFAWQHFKPKCDFVWGPHKKLRRFKPQPQEFLSHQKSKKEEETIRQETSDDVAKDGAGPPNKMFQRLNEELPQNGVGEVAEKDLSEPSNEHATDRTENNSPIGQPGSEASTKSNFPSSDSMADKMREKEPNDALEDGGLQGDDAEEPQASLDSKSITTSEGSNISSLALPAEIKEEEKQLDKEDPPVPPLGWETENGAEGESLKEAKKRKLEMSRLSRGKVELLKSPTDIEKISFNLEEVVIEPKDTGQIPLGEKPTEALVLEKDSGDVRDIKEVESVIAAIKRRKIEEMTPSEGAFKTPGRVDTELIATEGQIANCSASKLEGTDEICQDKIKTSVDFCVCPPISCKTGGLGSLLNSQASSKTGLALDNSGSDKTDEQETTSLTENKGSLPSESQPDIPKEVDKPSGQEEAEVEGKKEATTEGNVADKVEKSKKIIAEPEEE